MAGCHQRSFQDFNPKNFNGLECPDIVHTRCPHIKGRYLLDYIKGDIRQITFW